MSSICFFPKVYTSRAFLSPVGSSAVHICCRMSQLSEGVSCLLIWAKVALAYRPCSLSIAMISVGVASTRIISMPNIGVTEMTIIESCTVCIVTAEEILSSSVMTVACTPCMRQVCHVGTTGSGSAGCTAFFFAPHPQSRRALLNTMNMLLYFISHFLVITKVPQCFVEVKQRQLVLSLQM